MLKVIALLLVGTCLSFYIIVSKETESIDEKMVEKFYQKYLDNQNSDASKQFGALVKTDKKVTLKEFKLDKCDEKNNYYVCKAVVLLDTPKNGVQTRDLEFYLKKSESGFDISMKQV